MDSLEIRHLIHQIQQLPTIPSVALKILALAKEKYASVDEISQVIEKDQALTSKLLKVANSPFYGRSFRVKTIKDAVVVIGFDTLRSIALSISIIDVFQRDKSQKRLMDEQFWLHCLACAICAERLSKRMGVPFVEEAFLAGLIHDIGKVVLDQYCHQDYERVLEKADSNYKDVSELENEIIGFDHTTVGRWLLEAWKLPPLLSEGVWLHHQPINKGWKEHESYQLGAVLNVADTIAHIYRIGSGGDRKPRDLPDETLELLGLTKEDINQITSDLHKNINEMANQIGLSGVEEETYFEALQTANLEIGEICLLVDQERHTLERRNRELEALYEFSRMIQGENHVNRALEILAESILSAMDAQKVLCHFNLPSGGFIETEATMVDGRTVKDTRITKMPDTIEDAEAIRIPLTTNGESLGQIRVWQRGDGGYGGHETKILCTFAHMAATALNRMSIHTRFEEVAERLKCSATEREKAFSELKRVNEQLEQEIAEHQQTEIALKERTGELEDFTYMVSHDLKEPLRWIDSFSQFVLDDYKHKLDDEGTNYLADIRKGTKRMKRMIDDLLMVSKVTRTKNPYETVNASEIVKEAVEKIKPGIEAKGVDLIVAQDLPNIHCDRFKMEIVFSNLLTNAVKFMDKEKPRVEIGYIPDDDHKFYVRDNGIGIEQEYHQRIFGMFQRLEKTKEYEGTGAGLYITKKIIEEHKGDIWVESERGKGTTFYFTLPKVSTES